MYYVDNRPKTYTSNVESFAHIGETPPTPGGVARPEPFFHAWHGSLKTEARGKCRRLFLTKIYCIYFIYILPFQEMSGS